MKRYSFGTFLVDDTNREAFDVCNDVAALRMLPVYPILLLAPHGGGKTHLLYAIANRIKATRPGTTLGFVRAGAFPPQVRDLVDDPAPIEQASSAVFLVDDVDEFTGDVESLESVVRLFLEHGHAVVMASNASPEFLENLTPGLREMLSGGWQIRVGSYRETAAAHRVTDADDFEPWGGVVTQYEGQPPPGPFPPATGNESTDDELVELRTQIQALKTELEEARAELALKKATELDVERLRNAVDELKGRLRRATSAAPNAGSDAPAKSHPSAAAAAEKLRAALSRAKAIHEADQSRIAALEKELSALQNEMKLRSAQDAEIAYLKREVAELNQARQEHAALRDEFQTMRADHRQLQQQLTNAAEARDKAVAELTGAHQRIAELEAQTVAQHTENRDLIERLQGLVQNLEKRRARAQEEGHDQEHLLDEIAQLAVARLPLVVQSEPGVPVQPGARLEALLTAERKAAKAQWEEQRKRLEETVLVAQDRANEAGAECARLHSSLEQQDGQIRDLQQTLASLTVEKKRLSTQLDALRGEHDEQAQNRNNNDAERARLREEVERLGEERRRLATALEERRIEIEMTRIALEAREHDDTHLKDSVASVTKERDSARKALDSVRVEFDRLRAQHKTVQRRLETALAELDALRHEAATQVAAAHAQTGELEKRLSSTREQYRHSQNAGQAVAKELRALEKRFMETAQLVGTMSSRLTSAIDDDASAAESAYLYALTREDSSEVEQLPLDMAPGADASATGGDTASSQANPYDEEKFIPFKPAEHKINRTI